MQYVRAIWNLKVERAGSAFEVVAVMDLVNDLQSCSDCTMVVRAATTTVNDLQMWPRDQ